MRSKLAVLLVVAALFSLPYAAGKSESEANSEPEPATVVNELRREIAALKERIAELEARLARLESQKQLEIQRQLPRRIIPNQWQDPDQGSYLRFPIEVERAMMRDAAVVPRMRERQYPLHPPSAEVTPGAIQEALPRFELPREE